MAWEKRGCFNGSDVFAAVAGPRDIDDPDARYLVSVAVRRGNDWRTATREIGVERTLRRNVAGRLAQRIDRFAQQVINDFDRPTTPVATDELIHELSGL